MIILKCESALNKEKALVGAFFVIENFCEGSFSRQLYSLELFAVYSSLPRSRGRVARWTVKICNK